MKNKRLFNAFWGVLILFLMTACQSSSNESDHQKDSIDFSDIYMLTLDAEIPEQYPEEVTVYRLKTFDLDVERVAETLLKHEPDSVTEDATGPYYQWNDHKEILSMDTELIGGGLNYSYSGDEEFVAFLEKMNLKESVTRQTDFPNYMGISHANELLLPFSETDLSFRTREDILQNIQALFTSCGFPDISVRYCWSRDKDTLNKNLSILNEKEKDVKERMASFHSDQEPVPFEPIEYTFTEKDEDYKIIFQEMIGDLPISNRPVAQDNGSNDTFFTNIEVTCAENGVQLVRIVHLFDVLEETGNVKVCSPEEALKTYIEEFDQKIHFNETHIIDIELCYIPMAKKNEEGYYSKPVWVISIMTEENSEESGDYPEYSVVAIDTETKEIIRSHYFINE